MLLGSSPQQTTTPTQLCCSLAAGRYLTVCQDGTKRSETWCNREAEHTSLRTPSETDRQTDCASDGDIRSQAFRSFQNSNTSWEATFCFIWLQNMELPSGACFRLFLFYLNLFVRFILYLWLFVTLHALSSIENCSFWLKMTHCLMQKSETPPQSDWHVLLIFWESKDTAVYWKQIHMGTASNKTFIEQNIRNI